MKKVNALHISLIGLLLATAPAFAGHREIRLHDAPEAIRNTIHQHGREGHVDDIEVRESEGRKLYIADIDLPQGRDLKLHIAADGALLKTIEDVTLAEAPAPVRQSLEGLGGKIEDLEKETAGGVATYHAEIDRKDQRDLQVSLSADGKISRQVEETDD